MNFNICVYQKPDFEVVSVDVSGVMCGSGSGTADNYGPGTDFGGKDRWEEKKW